MYSCLGFFLWIHLDYKIFSEWQNEKIFILIFILQFFNHSFDTSFLLQMSFNGMAVENIWYNKLFAPIHCQYHVCRFTTVIFVIQSRLQLLCHKNSVWRISYNIITIIVSSFFVIYSNLLSLFLAILSSVTKYTFNQS